LADKYPEYPYVYWSANGTTLLFDALRHQQRRTAILPAFICPTLSAMVLKSGMDLVHIDVDRRTLHMSLDTINETLAEHDASDTVLLVDHTFGYPCTAIKNIRRHYPDLLIIEDCVRALGAGIAGTPIGHDGDWVLFSLYKTTVGNSDGAILLTRSPCHVRSGSPLPPTLMQWASGVRPCRAVYSALKRLAPVPLDEHTTAELDWPEWIERVGFPNALCQRRFATHLRRLQAESNTRTHASKAIQEAMDGDELLEFIQVDPGSRAAGTFLSFTLSPRIRRDVFIKELHRMGHFLAWAWSVVPHYYRSFAASFPRGAAESVFLAQHICHVPLDRYVTTRHRTRLIEALRATSRRILH
jgi:dTDP-4-amino-4,6-dideoxygalactose transaminase